MPELTRAELKAQINELEEMLTACEVERDALKDELLNALRALTQHQAIYIRSQNEE